jgi:cyclopropane fatty-acyl-phospholipid synthase-like methyltransferase/methyltransferase-like protein
MPESAAASYDALPYEGHPDPVIHPDRMAAVAWLHNIPAPPLEHARILEIGCATGTHLLPMAYQFPEATFLGFDCSPRQIAMARQTAELCGLTNLRFEVRDILDDSSALGEFDYILAHGVFSWVPPKVQQALLTLCDRHLAPQGVALVDYNVTPGWHLRAFLRDLVRFHQQENSNAAMATTNALGSLDFIASHLFENGTPFAQSVANLHHWAASKPKNYLVHELGDGHAEALSFSDFADRAQQHHLSILGDADITHVVPAALAAPVGKRIHEIAGDDYVRQEQYLDFLRGRDFRRSLLIRERSNLSRQLTMDALDLLHFTTMARLQNSPQGPMFVCPDGARLLTTNPGTFQALAALCNAGASGLDFKSLLKAANNAPGAQATIEQFGNSLLEIVAGNVVQMHAHRPRVANSVTHTPLASSIARTMAATGGATVTSMLQRDWHLDEFERQLLPLLDGTRTLSQIVEKLTPLGQGNPTPAVPPSPIVPPEHLESRIHSSLQWFARAGLLIA